MLETSYNSANGELLPKLKSPDQSDLVDRNNNPTSISSRTADSGVSLSQQEECEDRAYHPQQQHRSHTEQHIRQQHQQQQHHKQQINQRQQECDSTPCSVLRVKFVDTERPSPILPSAISPVSRGLHVHTTPHSDLLQASFVSSSNSASTPSPAMLTSSYIGQPAEEYGDNPFRPNGDLSHEVEPIVQQYKSRPWPLSRYNNPSYRPGTSEEGDETSHLISSNVNSPNDECHRADAASQQNASPGNFKAKKKSKTGFTTNSTKDNTGNNQQDHPDAHLNGNCEARVGTAEVLHGTLVPPQAKTVELVHVEDVSKKRKGKMSRLCACCGSSR